MNNRGNIYRFFEKVTFQVSRERAAEIAFYLESVALFCNTIAISFNPHTLFGAQHTEEILQKWAVYPITADAVC